MLPGEPSSAKQCAGADNVETAFKDIRDRLIDVLSGSVVFLIIVDFFIGIFAAWLFSTVLGSVVAVMIWSLATALLSMTPESVAEQLTDAVMDEFKCLVFCRLNDDGQLTYETWVQLMADIDDHFTGFPETFFHGIVAALGYNGINAMCSAGAATAEDCDECECGEWCYYWDFSIDDGSWSPEWGFYNTGCCWEGVDLGGGNMSLFAKKTGVGHLTKVEAYYSFGTMGDCDFFVDDVSVGGILNQFSGIKTWNVDIDITTDVGFNPSSGASYGAGNSVECLWVKLTGTGANPFGENNCP